MGNDSSKDFSLDEKIETVSSNIWTLYRCLNADGSPSSVFLYDLTSPRCKRQFVENAAKYLKILRHPHIIRFQAISYSSREAWLVTEHVTPLELLLESLTADEIVAGLYNLIEALSFLHDRGGLCHNNVSISSVFVADDGTWKLGAMECVCPSAEASSAFLLQCQSIRSEKIVAPEEKNQNTSAAYRFSHDVYALGVFADYVLEYLIESGQHDILGEKVKSFHRIVQEDLLNAVPNERPKLSALLDDCFFRTDFIEVSCFLKQITVKTEDEKSKFFRTIVRKLYHLPQRLVATRLVKPLLSRFVVLEHEACQHLIPHLLLPASSDNRCSEYRESEINPVLAEPFFRRYVIPEIFKIFHVRDAHIRCVLLRHFHQYAELFDRAFLSDVIFPQILLSVRDANDELVTLSLNAIAFLVPILGGDIIVGSERPRLFYEGIPKHSSAVNGHLTFVPNGLATLSQNDLHAVVSANYESGSIDRNSSSNQNLLMVEKRQQKREEAKKRLEERRRKREEEQRHSIIHNDAVTTDRSDVLQRTAEDKEEDDGNISRDISRDRDAVEDQNRVPQSPQSLASYDRTDSEIELEIEAELEAMKEAEKKTADAVISHAIGDTRPPVKVDWSDVSPAKYASSSQTGLVRQSKGRLKLTAEGTEREDDVKIDSIGYERAVLKKSADNLAPAKVNAAIDDQWDDAGWQDFDDVRQISSDPRTENLPHFDPSAVVPAKTPAAIRPRTKSVEEPLGAGYDIMLINVKTKPNQQTEEFDFFADMAPEIKPSGDDLLTILSGRTGDKERSRTPKAKKTSAEKSQQYVKSFDVISTDAAGATDVDGGWDAELDWNVDNQL